LWQKVKNKWSERSIYLLSNLSKKNKQKNHKSTSLEETRNIFSLILLQAVRPRNCFRVNCVEKCYALKHHWNVILRTSMPNVKKNTVASYAKEFIVRAIRSWHTSIRIISQDPESWIWRISNSFRIPNVTFTT
jgi:hypothetical protein